MTAKTTAQKREEALQAQKETMAPAPRRSRSTRRSNRTETSEAKADKTRDPIAVVDRHGHILPFTRNHVDRFYLMQADVTYIWTKGELERVLEKNLKAIEKDMFDRVERGDVLPPLVERPPVNAVEAQAAVFNPGMLQPEE